MLSKKDPSPMLQRYITAMRDYLFTLEHLPGIRNILPDVLSRRFPGYSDKEQGLNAITRSQTNNQQSLTEQQEKRKRHKNEVSATISGHQIDEAATTIDNNGKLIELTSEKYELKDAQVAREKNDLQDAIEAHERIIPKEPLTEPLKDAQEAHKDSIPIINNDIAMNVGVEMDDPSDRLMNDGGTEAQRREIIMLEHLANHQGREATYKSLVDKGYHWKTMRAECGQTARECLQCLRHNVEQHGFHPLTTIRTKLPMDHVAIDHYTMNVESNGYHAILLIVDICTGFVFLRPVKDYTASEAMKACLDVFTLFGFPKAIQSDNGTAFVAQLAKQFFDQVGVDQRTVTAYHPRANGAAEIRVKSAKTLAYKVLQGAITDWAFALPMINYWLNQRIQEKTGSTPFMYMFARRGNAFKNYRDDEGGLTMDEDELMKRYRIIKEIIFPGLAKRKNANQDIIEQRYNKKKRIVDTNHFPPGAMVMVKDPHRTSKHEPMYTGPYSVLRRTKGKSYVLLDHGRNELFPRDVAPSQMKLVSNTPIEDTEERFDVEAILKHRGKKGSYEYLVRWKGYGRDEDSWEPAKQFDSPALIEQYWKRRKGSGPRESDLRGHMNQQKVINQIIRTGLI
jgi:transposase InsO family protein